MSALKLSLYLFRVFSEVLTRYNLSEAKCSIIFPSAVFKFCRTVTQRLYISVTPGCQFSRFFFFWGGGEFLFICHYLTPFIIHTYYKKYRHLQYKSLLTILTLLTQLKLLTRLTLQYKSLLTILTLLTLLKLLTRLTLLPLLKLLQD